MKNDGYPHIVTCGQCGHRTAILELERYPVPVEELVAAMNAYQCQCGAGQRDAFMDQSAEAKEWYDAVTNATLSISQGS